MHTIKIYINSEESIFDDLNISVDKIPVTWTYTDNIIHIDLPIKDGFHALRIQIIGESSRLSIKDVAINNDSIRHTLYLSYVVDNVGNKHQPATCLWEQNQTWVMPFAVPLSLWLSKTGEKIPLGVYGNDLYKDYAIFYPEAANIDKRHAQMVRDYFAQDFDFCIFKKSELTLTNIPFQFADIGIQEELYHEAQQEIFDNMDLMFSEYDLTGWRDAIDSDGKVIGTNAEITHSCGMGETGKYDLDAWLRYPMIEDGKYTSLASRLPKTCKFLESLNINNIWILGLAFTKPYSTISPHIDIRINDRHLPEDYVQIQFGMTENPGAVIKLSGIGLLPLERGAFLFNNDKIFHSVVNDDPGIRIRVLMKVKASDNQHLFNIDNFQL
jgi:hypothetical protein